MKNFSILLVGCMLAAPLGCGGKVLVDGTAGSGDGQGGGGSTSSSGSGGACTPMPAMGNAVIMVCADTSPSGGCAEDQVADKVSALHQACPNDTLCVCKFDFVSSPCPPGPGCCYQVEVKPIAVACQ